MIIKLTSTSICIDELPKKPKKGWVYLLTRPFVSELDNVIHTPWIQFFTTPLIKKIMRKKKNFIPSKHLNTLNLSNKNLFRLPGNGELEVTVIPTESVSGNIMLYFQIEGRQMLYTGDFTEYRAALCSDQVRQAIERNSIDDLYIDNTLAFGCNMNCPIMACESILELFKENPQHTIFLDIGSIGFEDLLLMLAKESRTKIKINPLRSILFEEFKLFDRYFTFETSARIQVRNMGNGITLDEIRRRFEMKKEIFCRLSPSEKGAFQPKKHTLDGLVMINYSCHPSPFELYSFISSIHPKRILPIHKYEENDPFASEKTVIFPPLLTDLCAEMPNKLDHSFSYARDSFIGKSASAAKPKTTSDTVVSVQRTSATLAPEEESVSSFLNDTPYSMVLDEFSLSIEKPCTQLTQHSVKVRDNKKTIPKRPIPKILRKVQELVQYDASSSDQGVDSDTSDITMPF